MKIYIPKIRESWIVDRYKEEWIKYNKNIFSKNILYSEIIWIIAPWMWRRIPKFQLKKKKVICSYHHFVNEKFDDVALADFKELDSYVDKYHAISPKTFNQLKNLTEKQIVYKPFWVNQNIFFPINDKKMLRKKYNIPIESYIIGSFQRDTESSDFKSPKLEKGPDILVSILKQLNDTKKNKLLVLLSGKNRQFIKNELKKENIKFIYFEMVSLTSLNELYNLLDLYIVSSRVEGGPAAIFECASSKTPIISTDVGIASEILSQKSIYFDNFEKAYPDIEIAYNKVAKFFIPSYFKEFNNHVFN